MRTDWLRTLGVALLAAGLLAGCGGAQEREVAHLKKGKAYLAEGNLDKARVEFKNVLQIDPKSADGHFYFAQLEERKKNWGSAFGHYSKVVELDPDYIAARNRLAQFYIWDANGKLKQGDKEKAKASEDKAREQLEEVLKRDPKNADALTLKAALLAQDGKNADARAALETLLNRKPDQVSAVQMLATLYQKDGEPEKAVAVLKRGLTKVPDSVELHLKLAQVLAAMEKSDDAAAEVKKVIAMKPDELGYRLALANFYTQLKRLDDAEKVLRDAVAADPEDIKRELALVEFLSKQRGPDQAIAELNQAIQAHPDENDLRFALARVYQVAKKDDAKAIEVLQAIVDKEDTEPAGLRARDRIAQIRAAEGKFDQASTLVEEVLKENPKDNDALVLKGRIAFTKGDLDTAIAAFRSVLKDQPNSAEVLTYLAQVQLKKGDTELAGQNLRRAVEGNPANVDARVRYVRYLMAVKRLDDALQQVDKGLAIAPRSVPLLIAKSDILGARGDAAGVIGVLQKLQAAAPDNPQGAVRLAKVFEVQKKLDRAQKVLDDFLAKHPKSKEALLQKSEVMAARNDVAGVRQVLQRLVQVAPELPEAHLRLGRLALSQKQKDAALAEYRKAYAVAKGKQRDRVLEELTQAEVKLGEADAARKRLQGLLAEHPDHPLANALLGLVEMQTGHLDAAEKAFQRQVEVTPKSDQAYARLAAVRMQRKDYDGAMAAYQAGLKVLGDNVRLLLGVAAVHENRKDFDQAIATYRKVLKVQPDNALATNNLAALLADQKTDKASLDEARKLAEKLARTRQPVFLDTLGWVYYRTGDYAKAVKVLEKVVAKQPRVAEFQYHLGMAYARSGQKDKARKALQAALDLGHFTHVREARQALDAL